MKQCTLIVFTFRIRSKIAIIPSKPIIPIAVWWRYSRKERKLFVFVLLLGCLLVLFPFSLFIISKLDTMSGTFTHHYNKIWDEMCKKLAW